MNSLPTKFQSSTVITRPCGPYSPPYTAKILSPVSHWGSFEKFKKKKKKKKKKMVIIEKTTPPISDDWSRKWTFLSLFSYHFGLVLLCCSCDLSRLCIYESVYTSPYIYIYIYIFITHTSGQKKKQKKNFFCSCHKL